MKAKMNIIKSHTYQNLKFNFASREYIIDFVYWKEHKMDILMRYDWVWGFFIAPPTPSPIL